MTADHRVLSEENESRLQHRYAVVVQDLWLRGTHAQKSCAWHITSHACLDVRQQQVFSDLVSILSEVLA